MHIDILVFSFIVHKLECLACIILICSQSEDVELIENELALAKEQIEEAKSFQQECKQLRQQPPSMIHNGSTRASNLTYILIVDLVDYDKPSEEKKKKNKIKTR